MTNPPHDPTRPTNPTEATDAAGSADPGGSGSPEPDPLPAQTPPIGPDLPEPPHPINWDALTAADAAVEWLRLDAWVTWLRLTYALPPTEIPPLWHRHPPLVRELSALHLHWLNSYDPEQDASAPLAWHADLHTTRDRLREWVATIGTKLDRDRPTQPTQWPGDPEPDPATETTITNRNQDFIDFVAADVESRDTSADIPDPHDSRK